jgi:hypothetical protein
MILRFSGPADYTVVTTPMFDSEIVDCRSWDEAVASLHRIKDLKV